MQTITLAFDLRSRVLTADCPGAGTVIDDAAVQFHLDPIEGVSRAELFYNVLIYNGGRRYHPIGRFDEHGNLRLSQQVLAACTGGQLPISLRLTYPDRRAVGSRQLILPVEVVPDAYESVSAAWGDELMLRTDGWQWIPEWTYGEDSVVLWDTRLWRSYRDDNRGHVPEEDSEWWELMTKQGETGPRGPPGEQGLPAESTTPGEIVVRYIGDGIRTEWDVVHNLHTMTPFCQLIHCGGEVPRYTDTRIEIIDDCHVRVCFHTPPEPDSVQVLVSSGMGTAAPAEATVPGEFVRRYVGNGRDTVFDVVHNLNCDTPFVQMLQASGDDPLTHMDTAWQVVDSNTIRVYASPAPEINGLVCLISSGMGTGADLSPYRWTQETPSSEWRIEHGLGRPMAFAVYDTEGRRVHCGEVIESDLVTVEHFAEEIAGFAVGW